MLKPDDITQHHGMVSAHTRTNATSVEHRSMADLYSICRNKQER